MSWPSPVSSPVPLAAPDPVPRLLRDLVHERMGIFFEDDRFDTLLEKLEPRARELGCVSYLDYYYILKYEERGPEEWRRVMDAFSVQETYFWREFDQIRALTEHIVPVWFKSTTQPLRVWSAACATGEEPYTIAMALREAGWADYPIEIQATDGSEAALARAREGVYRERSFRALPPSLREKYFTVSEKGYRLNDTILSRVRFRWGNLVNPVDIGPFASADVIFCRNVFIYFSPSAISRVLGTFAERMPAEGRLFVGASESLLKLTKDFDLTEIAGAFVYVRRASR